jgi:hypothetical protein
MRNIKTILSVAAYFIVTSFTTENKILKRSEQIKKELLDNYSQASYLSQQFKFTANDIVAIPTCFVKINSEDLLKKINIEEKIAVDTSYAFGLVYKGQTPFYTVHKEYKSYSFSLIGDLESKATKNDPPTTLNLIAYTKKLGSNLFFVSLPFDTGDIYSRDILGYFDHGVIKFTTMRLGKIQSLDNFDDLVKSVFGTKVKYIEILEDSQQKSKATTMSIDEAKNIYKSDYLTRSFAYPKDTVINVAAMVNYINGLTPISDEQKILIQSKALQLIGALPNSKLFLSNSWVLYGLSFDDLIYRSLEKKQYYELQEKNRQMEKLQEIAVSKMYHYFIREKHLSEKDAQMALKNIFDANN